MAWILEFQSRSISLSLSHQKACDFASSVDFFGNWCLNQSQSRSYVTNFEISLSKTTYYWCMILLKFIMGCKPWTGHEWLPQTTVIEAKEPHNPAQTEPHDIVNISIFHFISGSSSTLPRNLLSGSRDDVNSGHSDSKHSNSSSVYGEGNITPFNFRI